MMDKTEIELSGVVFKSAEPLRGSFCFGCAFFFGGEFDRLCSRSNELQGCSPPNRADGQHVIWVRA